MNDHFGTLNHASPEAPRYVPPDFEHDPQPNVHGTERVLSAVGGALLLVGGLRRGGLVGLLETLAGGGLLARSATGQCAIKRALMATPYEEQLAREHGWNTAAAATGSVTINRPRSEVYQFWRNFDNLAKFMEHIEYIEVLDEKRSRWVIKAPMGQTVEWISHITEDLPNERIAWETEYDADVRSSGWVEFKDAPGGRGAEVRAVIAYEPPGGRIGHLAAKLWREDPTSQAHGDLRRFKQVLETGSTTTSASHSD